MYNHVLMNQTLLLNMGNFPHDKIHHSKIQVLKFLHFLDIDYKNYPKKNWSSLILWNCNHPKHKILTPDFIAHQTGKYLHRFSWLDDNDIGELPKEWNWLAIEYPENVSAKLIHYTLGTPCFIDYRKSEMSSYWLETYQRMLQGFE